MSSSEIVQAIMFFLCGVASTLFVLDVRRRYRENQRFQKRAARILIEDAKRRKDRARRNESS